MKKLLSAVMAMSVSLFSMSQAVTPSKITDRDFNHRIKTVSGLYPFSSNSLDTLSADARECMKWLYAYMQTPDITAYSPDFFLANVSSSLKAKAEMPWGKSVPEREFRHFVLPVRVNNENLDLSRPVFYEELKDRVKGKTMKDAIQEVNHWCHEKVTYQPSDARTSSPLSSVSQAIGRCGEESTFTVAALRSVGIPARQVYTPRWAHTDDNHAWVEAWADGKWYFIGACEPAPDLNMAWFNAPASRGLLMTTKVFGPYDGPEEVLKTEPLLTTINVTSNYAPVADLKVRVFDKYGRPAKGAKVNFCIYNYADLYPAATKIADLNGEASLLAGIGDMVIWATDGNDFGYAKGNSSQKTPLEIRMDKPAGYSGVFEFDIVPPRQSGSLPVASEQAEKLNNMRLAHEDSIRKAYTSTFFTVESARAEADRLGVDAGRLSKILVEARGNGKALLSFVEGCGPTQRQTALDLLEAISEKDRRDVSVEVLKDNLENTRIANSPLFVNYVLNPRVENEGLVPYKAFFSGEISPEDVRKYRKDPSKLVEWTARNIRIDTIGNPTGVRMDPRAVWRTALADPKSRSIFFVAVSRSLGIPAHIDAVTGKTQYAGESGEWRDVVFDSAEKASAVADARTGDVFIRYEKEGRLENPKYYSQFSIERLENGVPMQLEYGEGDGINEIANDGLKLDEGSYLLLSGRRMADGSVLARGEIFNVRAGESTEVPLKIRKDDNALSVIGSLNAENIYHDMNSDSDKSILSTTGRGYYVAAFVKPGDEPSSHILNDISLRKQELEKAGNKIMILLGNQGELKRFNPESFPNLPTTAVIGVDNDGVSLAEITKSLNLASDDRPIVVVADTFNRVVYTVQGYTIGIGDRLAETLRELNQ